MIFFLAATLSPQQLQDIITENDVTHWSAKVIEEWHNKFIGAQ